jgi:hypothetical protein
MRSTVTISIFAITVIVAFSVRSVRAEQYDNKLIREAQITALQTGDVTPLSQFAFASPTDRLALDLTKEAIDEFSRQLTAGRLPRIDVSRESALSTSDFIRHGAEVAIQEDPLGRRRSEAERNVRRLVDTMIEVSIPEQGKIGETTLEKASRSFCPLWPFC